ncbi:DUF3889 domain-containing protein [Radiobacillus sp. PE A8.2]|uniref:DUF3889 domain-containing protein n=1 Tax=Radiobacillus sp. PE A8.2 TaxID=3380349 RepID=UPI003890978E
MYNQYPYQPNHYYGSYIPSPGYYGENPNTRHQPIKGQATWTEGGPVTQCGIPWSNNTYMTAAVGVNSPYPCGQSLKIRSIALPQREIIVTVVDKVAGYPPNKINLHRKAFEALGADPAVGVINVEIFPSPQLEQEKWGKYLLELTQTAYPNYEITNYNLVSKEQLSSTQTKETYDFILKNTEESIKIRGAVIYNSRTDRVISFDIKEL